MCTCWFFSVAWTLCSNVCYLAHILQSAWADLYFNCRICAMLEAKPTQTNKLHSSEVSFKTPPSIFVLKVGILPSRAMEVMSGHQGFCRYTIYKLRSQIGNRIRRVLKRVHGIKCFVWVAGRESECINYVLLVAHVRKSFCDAAGLIWLLCFAEKFRRSV